MSEFDRMKAQKDAILAKEAVKIASCEVNRIVAERDSFKSQLSQVQGELEKSHKAFDSMEESFLKTSAMLTEACMKNKSLYEQFNLWKAERDSLKAENEKFRAVLEKISMGCFDDECSCEDIARGALQPREGE